MRTVLFVLALFVLSCQRNVEPTSSWKLEENEAAPNSIGSNDKQTTDQPREDSASGPTVFEGLSEPLALEQSEARWLDYRTNGVIRRDARTMVVLESNLAAGNPALEELWSTKDSRIWVRVNEPLLGQPFTIECRQDWDQFAVWEFDDGFSVYCYFNQRHLGIGFGKPIEPVENGEFIVAISTDGESFDEYESTMLIPSTTSHQFIISVKEYRSQQ